MVKDLIRTLIVIGCLIIVTLTGVTCVQAQQPTDPELAADETSRTESMFMPSIGYISDLGLIGGLGFNRYHLRDNYQPYYSLFDANLMASTRGFFLIQVRFNRTETLGQPVRSDFDFHGLRQPNTLYFGFGNDSSFDSDLYEEEYYYYESLSFGLSYEGRIPIHNNDDRRFDALLHLGAAYDTPRNVGEDRFLYQQQPRGFEDGGFLNQIGTGLMYESRDSELDPTEGFYSRLDWQIMNSLWLSDYDMQRLNAQFSAHHTVPWLGDLRLAGRIGASQVFGDVPFWKYPSLGGEDTIRGYAIDRFRGDGRLYYNLEMRKWLFDVESIMLRFGAHVFTDGGRIIDFTDNADMLFTDHKRTYGGGISYQILDSNMMLRIEAGFSDEMWRLYVGTGFMF